MQPRSRCLLWGLASLAALIVTASCSTGPQPLQPGTPPFYWAAAQHTFETGDYLKTSDNLDKLAGSQNEYTARAQPWRLILTSGIASGLMDVADSYEKGARVKKAAMASHLTQMAKYRSRADRQALQCGETFLKFKNAQPGPAIELAFGYPRGSALPVQGLMKIAQGILVPEAELESIERQSIERSVLMMTSRAVGAEGDPAKAQEAFRTTPVQVPREKFRYAMAAAMRDFADFYGPRKLDRPDRQKLFLEEALDALKGLPETKDSKKLTSDIRTILKKLPKR